MKERKGILGTIFTLMMLIMSTIGNVALFAIPLAAVAPASLAANGLGEVTFLSIDGFESPITQGVQTVNTTKNHVFKIHNDDPVGGNCIDEIIIQYPNSWQGAIDLSSVSVTNLGNVIITNETDDGTLSGLVNSPKAIRIVPDFTTNGVMLCPSGTTQISIGHNNTGLASPLNPEYSTVTVYTSDQGHNEPNSNDVRDVLTNTLPVIHVTAAQNAIIQYIDFLSVAAGTSPAKYTLNAQAKGAWGRVTELYFNASAGMTVDVYVEKSGPGLQTGTDFKIASGIVLVPGVNVLPLTYTGVEDVSGQMIDGYLKDAEQGGLARNFYIDITTGAGTLSLVGHADEDAAEDIDPTYSGTEYTNPPKEGTVINVENAMKRKILVQLVREHFDTSYYNATILLYVEENNVPIYYTTDLSTFADASPRLTDTDGQVEIRLNPGTTAANALVNVCFPDPSCTNEDVAISPGAPVSCEITEGKDVSVEAGSIVTIEATVYDQYGNVIANSHYNNAIPSSIVADTPLVTFDLVSAPANDSDLDDDTNPPFTGDGDGFEQEITQLGIADASLQTSSTVGANVVHVFTSSLDCGTTTVTGTLGQAGDVDCEVVGLASTEIESDDCFDVMMSVKDANGNPLSVWESIVQFSLVNTSKTIQSTDLREENFLNPYTVQGKLNPDAPAQAMITVCGCDELGDLVVVCKSDTLNDDDERLTVVNSQPTCIDIDADHQQCSDDINLATSILDTCGNKVVDQECQEGGFASSCIRLDASCGELSTDKTCVDLGNTGDAPGVYWDTSACGCGPIEILGIDEADCCDSVYEGALPTCDFDKDGIFNESLVINKLGPATHIGMSVYPKADNQDDFFVSEKTVLDLRLLDACEQETTCGDTEVDVKLTGEDCIDTSIQVNSPFTTDPAQGTSCTIDNEPLHKVVIQNCAPGSKDLGNKEWTDLPEKDDIVVDKIAFEYNGPQVSGVSACVYEETEETVGFQAGEDLLWKCVNLNTVPTVPSADVDAPGNEGAWDEIHDSDVSRNGIGDVYLIELDDRISKFNGKNEYDNQRLGGAIVEAGDSKDFYIVLNTTTVACGTYDADYLYFEDYNSPDIIGWTPYNFPGTHVLDTLEDSENYTRRNDDYTGTDPYPVTDAETSSYGFGDTELHNLLLSGSALVWFRDLVAETINIFVDANLPVVLDVTNGFPVSPDTQAEITFLTQPATQVVARNHGDLAGDAFICDDAGFEPRYEYDPDNLPENPERDCRPAMACDGEGYDINLQVTDGFQNQVGLATEVQLDACLEFPHYIYLGDSLIPNGPDLTIDLWEYLGHNITNVGGDPENGGKLVGSDPRDVCFNMPKFKAIIRDLLDEHAGDNLFAKEFVGSEEFDDFVNSMFAGKSVKFFDELGNEITQTDSIGHLIVTTDANGQARIRVESDDSSMFQVKSFDTSFRLFFTPHALDGDYFDVAFAPGAPSQWDVIAIPSTGIPADGEQEAKILIRKLDACGNAISLADLNEEVKVTAISSSGRAVISKDFSEKNNYDNQVQGYLNQMSCQYLFPWFEDCTLEVLDDVIEDVVVTVEDAQCDQVAQAFCTTAPGCNPLDNPACAGCSSVLNQTTCEAGGPELCQWVEEPICAQDSDSTAIKFVGAPVKLKITEIKHSDLLPADGYTLGPDGFTLPANACTEEEFQWCFLGGEPETFFKNCVQYGNTGAWVTVEVQDKYGNRVTGYLGDGFKQDPGDVEGTPDNVFEKVCVALDDPNAFISSSTFGWIGLNEITTQPNSNVRVYCGDLAYGKGSFNVVYSMLDNLHQPLDPRETRKVIASVFDVCDRDLYEDYVGNWKEDKWDDLCNAQEYNENNLPDSETASRLDPDSNKIIFTSVPDRWDIGTDKLVVAADGQDFATLTINTENEFMDVRARVDATVQSSLLGSKLESEAITPGCYVEGVYDPVNPTSINVQTEDCSGGRAELRLSSTEPGIARVTVTGNSFGCVLTSDGPGDEYIPTCLLWGVIPLTPKVIEVEFKQAFQNKIELKQGWNFFSVPKDLEISNDQWSELGLDTLCDASASWNDATQTWTSPVPVNTILTPMEGYWCKALSATTIDVVPVDSTLVFLPPTKPVFPGWNDVGLSTYVEMKIEHALISIDSAYVQILDWVEGLQRYNPMANTGEAGGGNVPGTTGTNNMEAGQGYFIYATDSGNLAGLS